MSACCRDLDTGQVGGHCRRRLAGLRLSRRYSHSCDELAESRIQVDAAAMTEPTDPPKLSLDDEWNDEARRAIEQARIDRRLAELSAALRLARASGQRTEIERIRAEQATLHDQRARL